MDKWHVLDTTFEKLIQFAESKGWRVENQSHDWAEVKTIYSSQGAAVAVLYKNQLTIKNIFGCDAIIERFKNEKARKSIKCS